MPSPSTGRNPAAGRQWIEWGWMRSLLVILLFFALAEPAAACRRYSIWHYNFPQPCLSDRSEAQATTAPPAPDIPLPDLTEINWGEIGDGRLAAIGMLRALSDNR